MDLAGLETLRDDLYRVAKRNDDKNLDRFGEDRAAEDYVRFQLTMIHKHLGPAALLVGDEASVFRGHHLVPAAVLLLSVQRRRAVAQAVQEVELMGEFVEHDVVAVGV